MIAIVSGIICDNNIMVIIMIRFRDTIIGGAFGREEKRTSLCLHVEQITF